MTTKADPGRLHAEVTPSDATDLDGVSALYCEAPGTAIVADAAGTEVTYTLVAGQVLPFQAKRVLVGSTATLVAWRN